MRVLFVDDNPAVLELLRRRLTHSRARSWTCEFCRTPAAALAAFNTSHGYDVVAMDLQLGNDAMSGAELARALRTAHTRTPFLLYSAGAWVTEARAECLVVGDVDDVFHMPFAAFDEFVARIERLGRRHSGTIATRQEIGGLIIDTAERTVSSHEGQVSLTRNQYMLVAFLASMSPRPCTYGDLLTVLGYESVGNRHAVGEAVRVLRLRLADCAVVIEVVPGVGYRLVAADERANASASSRSR